MSFIYKLKHMRKLLLFVFIIFIFSSCFKREKVIFIYNKSKSECVTIIWNKKFRYIIPEKCDKIPKSNYLKLDISHISLSDDYIYVCFHNKGWELVNPSAIIAYSGIDTSQYKFESDLPIIDKVPNQLKFTQHNCAIFGIKYMEVCLQNGTTIEF